MKKFTKFSLATIAVLGLSSGAYAVTSIDAGTGGTFTTANAADTLTVTASGGTTINSDVALNGELTNADDIFINADAGPGGYGGYGGVILQKADVTLMEVNENSDGGTHIYTNTTMDGNLYFSSYSDPQIQAPDNLILNVDSGVDGYGGYGSLYVQKADITLMSVGENTDGGTQIFTTTTMYDDLDMTGNQIHNVAPGTVGTDAVNLNQLNDVENDMSKGVAAATALANIPQVDQGKTYSLGIGYGHYNGENALAVGGSWRYNTDGIVKASLGTGGSGAVVGIGTAMSW